MFVAKLPHLQRQIKHKRSGKLTLGVPILLHDHCSSVYSSRGSRARECNMVRSGKTSP